MDRGSRAWLHLRISPENGNRLESHAQQLPKARLLQTHQPR